MFRNDAVDIDAVAGDAFIGMVHVLQERLKDHVSSVVIEQTSSMFRVEVRHDLRGGVLVPVTLSIQADAEDQRPRLMLRIGVGRIPEVAPLYRDLARDYIERTTELGANWIDKSKQAYELVYAAGNRVPEANTAEFQAATLDYCEACIGLVEQARRARDAQLMKAAELAAKTESAEGAYTASMILDSSSIPVLSLDSLVDSDRTDAHGAVVRESASEGDGPDQDLVDAAAEVDPSTNQEPSLTEVEPCP